MKRGENQKQAAPYDLKATRERLSLTQKEMAALLESAQSSIARWESEGTLPLIYRKYLELYEQRQVQALKAKRKTAAKKAA
jgi:DNA-binding XRE family transcriptional regulator